MIILQNFRYIHSNSDLLFDNINLNLNRHDKAALIGNNGTGKSTLLKIIAGQVVPTGGVMSVASKPYYVPQLLEQFNDFTIAQALQIADKLQALHNILNGEVTENSFTLLDDDWNIEERCHEALNYWQLAELDLTQKLNTLSGGQKTKVFLSGISIHQPELVLLDEPTNHLDAKGRDLLYEFIQSFNGTLLIVSHDRTLLNLLNPVYELAKHGIKMYGGNYEFYCEQKQTATKALNESVKSKEKLLRKAKETERKALERQQKQNAHGKKNQEKSGIPAILLGRRKDMAEKSASRLKNVHAEKIGELSGELTELRKELPYMDTMKMVLNDSAIHKGKILITATDINFGYNDRLLWPQPLNFQITGGERIVLSGSNGSGKTTLIKMMLGKLAPTDGTLSASGDKTLYIDQDYSLIDEQLTVYEQAQQFNRQALKEHEVKNCLNRFLFPQNEWDKSCCTLSGGEKMRLLLCCLTFSNQSPDMIILDEPTNSLDAQNIEILIAAINNYQGTLIVVSHDRYFLKQIGVEHRIEINR